MHHLAKVAIPRGVRGFDSLSIHAPWLAVKSHCDDAIGSLWLSVGEQASPAPVVGGVWDGLFFALVAEW